MTINVNQYQYDKICDQMKNEFGSVKKGEEERFAMLLFTMESNLLKTYRLHASSNSRRLSEAIPLTLFQIKSYLTGNDYNLDKFQSTDNERLVHALLMAFDPFTNEEIEDVLNQMQEIDLTDKSHLHLYFQVSIRCMLRIKESVDTWEKRMGSNGYFIFAEDFIGSKIHQDDEMKYTICLSEHYDD